jgi:hypothetical protein
VVALDEFYYQLKLMYLFDFCHRLYSDGTEYKQSEGKVGKIAFDLDLSQPAAAITIARL